MDKPVASNDAVNTAPYRHSIRRTSSTEWSDTLLQETRSSSALPQPPPAAFAPEKSLELEELPRLPRPTSRVSFASQTSFAPLNHSAPEGRARTSQYARLSKRISTLYESSFLRSDAAQSRWSTIGKRVSRPLSFRGSIWVKNPEDIAVGFSFVDDDETRNETFDPPHHVFDRKRKKRLVYLVSLAAMFSPLSSNIYFPALPSIAKELNTSATLISLTISSYMIFQGLAPSFWGPLADSYGRRPVLLSTLGVYIVANLVLAFSQNFAMLMALRGVQAIGSASTIAIGAGVIGDLAVAGERGGFMGLFGGIRMFGQAVGPVFGGALAQFLGFRSIFWFLFGLATLVTVWLGFVFPETLRKIAGDGSKPLYGVYKPWIQIFKNQGPVPKGERYQPTKLSFSALLESFRLLGEKDVFCALLFGSIIYTIWSMITASTPMLFKTEYHLSDVLIGLGFLPNGIGCVLGSLITGKIMDKNYKHEAAYYIAVNNLPRDTELKIQDHPHFPLERARLRSVYILTAVFAVATATFGFAVEWHIAIPLTLQFITAFTATAVFNINSTLMIDLYPSKPASATAVNNLARCAIGSVGVGLVDSSIAAINESRTFVILACVAGLSSGLVFINRKWGPGWRRARMERIAMENCRS